jgi:thiol-disulfide isomerase/thioredoxin
LKYHSVLLCICYFIVQTSLAQRSNCLSQKSKSELIYTVNSEEVICLAKSSLREKTLVFSFGIWCAPCIKHLPNAIELSKKYNLQFLVLLIDEEGSKRELSAISYLEKAISEVEFQTLILKDLNGKPKKKYKHFLNSITPAEFENISGMSKYILINNEGKVLMVTNWKDNRENKWDDDSKMIQQKLVPLLDK